MTENHLIRILKAGIKSVLPSRLFPRLLSNPSDPSLLHWLRSDRRYLMCAGKAAVGCAESILKASPCEDLFVLPPAGIGLSGALPPEKVHYGSHPVPDGTSLQATLELLRWLDALPDAAQLLAVISGGSSALLVAPSEGISPEAKFDLNRLLLSCGASIQEMNAVRKHCSSVKGGRLGLRVSRLQARVLLISDVIGDDPAVIGSGPFCADPTTFLDAKEALAGHGVWDAAPDEIRRHLQRGMSGKISETPKPGSLAIPHRVIASNEMARRTAADTAVRLGYAAKLIAEPVSGPVEKAAGQIFARIRECAPGTALIFGGEVTVRLRGSGTGGRNQHLALLMTEKLAGLPVSFAAAGTDGVDGNSQAAGAWTDGETATRSRALGLDLAHSIAGFDSFPFFQRLGQNLITGPTGTNVMDLYVALLL